MPRKTIRVEPMNAIKEEKHNEQPSKEEQSKEEPSKEQPPELTNQQVAKIIEEVKPKRTRKPKEKREEEPAPNSPTRPQGLSPRTSIKSSSLVVVHYFFLL